MSCSISIAVHEVVWNSSRICFFPSLPTYTPLNEISQFCTNFLNNALTYAYIITMLEIEMDKYLMTLNGILHSICMSLLNVYFYQPLMVLFYVSQTLAKQTFSQFVPVQWLRSNIRIIWRKYTLLLFFSVLTAHDTTRKQ